MPRKHKDCPMCGKVGLVRLSNHLADVHGLSQIEYLQIYLTPVLIPKSEFVYFWRLYGWKRQYNFHDVQEERSSCGLSVVNIIQNLFYPSKEHRTISLNASYLVLNKNVRDASQVIHLVEQLYPLNVKYFQQAYQLATKQPNSTYLLTWPAPVKTRYD